MNDNNFDACLDMIPEPTVEEFFKSEDSNIGKGLGGIATIIAHPFIKLGIISEVNIKGFDKKLLEKTSKYLIKIRIIANKN